jgi:hypothetical protein
MLQAEGQCCLHCGTPYKRALRDHGEGRADWNRLDQMTDAEVQACITIDRDWKDVHAVWERNAIPVTLKSCRLCASMPTSSPGSAPKAPATKPA